MGQVLHNCAATTHAVRAAIQRSKASVSALAGQYGINQKTGRKWRGLKSLEDAPMGSRNPPSTALSPEEEAICVAFRKHALLPLDDCLYALQDSLPHLTRSSLHRLTNPSHPWTNGQVEQMNRALKEATVKRYHYESHDQLREHLQTFVPITSPRD